MTFEQAAPFWSLVAHFVKRMFAGEDEQGSGGMSLGLGAVLAILASPGAFASVFLLDKYSTLLQWFRGQKDFDPYRASVSGRIFLRCSLHDDYGSGDGAALEPPASRTGRDFSNLAALPIPIRNIFLANFTALFGLALLFGIDVNAVSSFLFPAFVTARDGSSLRVLACRRQPCGGRIFREPFQFFAVFALVGLLMLVLPKRLVSSSVDWRAHAAGGGVAHANSFPICSCSCWRGTYQNGPISICDCFHRSGFWGCMRDWQAWQHRAWPSWGGKLQQRLLAAIVVAVAAYSLCYRRHFLRLAESLDVIGGTDAIQRAGIALATERIVSL